MRELETHQKLEEKNHIELCVKKKKEIEYILEGTIKSKIGHFIWEINEESGEIKKAEYEKPPVIFSMLKTLKPISLQLITKKGCVYIPALNAKNAKIKYLKDAKQLSYYVKKAPMDLNDISNLEKIKQKTKEYNYM